MRPAAALLNWPHFLPFVLLALIGRQIQQEQGDEVAVQGTTGGAGGGEGRGAGGNEGGEAGGAEDAGGGSGMDIGYMWQLQRDKSPTDICEE